MTHPLFFTVVTVALAAAGMMGCEQEKGPAEKAGAAIDEAVGKTGDKIEEMGEAIKEKSAQ